jgi:hypothetical protein
MGLDAPFQIIRCKGRRHRASGRADQAAVFLLDFSSLIT